jgi:hypothetical protein
MQVCMNWTNSIYGITLRVTFISVMIEICKSSDTK